MAAPTKRPSKVWAYARISKDDKGDSESPNVQLDEIGRYLAFKFPAAVGAAVEYGGPFVDRDVSGAIPLWERPAGKELLGRLEPGDHVVVAKLDRIFRSAIDGLTTYEQLRDMDINLHILNLPVIDLGNAMGECMFQVMLAFAQMERARISERISGLVAYRNDHGLPIFNKHPVGYKAVGEYPNNKYVPDLVQRADCRYLLELRLTKNLSYRQLYWYLNRHKVVLQPSGWGGPGKRWNYTTIYECVKAAKKGFPLRNGTRISDFGVIERIPGWEPEKKRKTKGRRRWNGNNGPPKLGPPS